MQSPKAINLKLYFGLTILNFVVSSYVFGNYSNLVIPLFLIGVLLNQYLLYKSLHLMLFVKKRTKRITAMIVGKFTILAATFMIALHYHPNKFFSFLLCYIFQLIILGLSNKRITKKN